MAKKKVAKKKAAARERDETKFARGLSPKGGGKRRKPLTRKKVTSRKNDCAGLVDVRRLSVADAARMFRETPLGAGTSAADLRRQIKAGAPVNEDGTIDLVAWCAWILEQGEKEEMMRETGL